MDWQHPLLENGPSTPVEEALRYRFSNRHPQTETIGLGLGYRVFQPVPLAPIGPSWKKPTGAFEAATLTQACNLFGTSWESACNLVGISNRYQRVFSVYPKFFYLFCLFFENCYAYPIELYSTIRICPYVVLEFKEYSKLTKSQSQAFS